MNGPLHLQNKVSSITYQYSACLNITNTRSTIEIINLIQCLAVVVRLACQMFTHG